MSDLKHTYTQWKAWMLLSQAGDAVAYQKLLKDITPFLHSFFKKKLKQNDVIHDLIQETLLAIHRSRQNFNANFAFNTWMYAIARHKLNDYFRYFFKQVQLNDHLANSEQWSNHLQNIESSMDLNSIVQFLKPEHIRLIQLLKIEGHSISDTAKKLNTSSSNIKVQMHRCLKKLKHIVKTQAFSGDKI